MANDTPATNSYDEVPYPETATPQTHPDRLATVARVFGMRPAPSTKCRVLELGCATGANLFPLAEAFPGSSFVGVDLSAKQIERGQQTVSELGLANLDLRHASLTEMGSDIGLFDYILCHGVYSWVPSDVQAKIFELCRLHLSANGVAYVSYNTYPGWHLRGMIRDMMQYHASRFNTPQQRVSQARALLRFLAKSVHTENNPYGMLLEKELQLLGQQSGSYLFHEHLESDNEPVYFHQFIERAQQHRLKFLGESDVSSMVTDNLPLEVTSTLGKIANGILQTEQYMDFLKNRAFRQTLLCHDATTLDRRMQPEIVEQLHLASCLQPAAGEVDLQSPTGVDFNHPNGRGLVAEFPLLKAALLYLRSCWPRFVPFSELAAVAQERLTGSGTVSGKDRSLLAAHLMRCYAAGVVDLSAGSFEFVTQAGDRPLASATARREARRGPQATNRLHTMVPLNDVDRLVLGHLDGSHDRHALTELLGSLVRDQKLEVRDQTEHETSSVASEPVTELSKTVDASLVRLANDAFLIG